MVKGTVFRYGDNVDTDVSIPARYLNAPSPEELAKHCMEDIDAAYATSVKPGDIMVGGWNFGCGSSREHAPIAIQASGAACVIAASFARIFYRNAINIGFPILECPATGVITDETTGQVFQANGFPPFIEEIIRCGGLLKYLKARQAEQGESV